MKPERDVWLPVQMTGLQAARQERMTIFKCPTPAFALSTATSADTQRATLLPGAPVVCRLILCNPRFLDHMVGYYST